MWLSWFEFCSVYVIGNSNLVRLQGYSVMSKILEFKH